MLGRICDGIEAAGELAVGVLVLMVVFVLVAAGVDAGLSSVMENDDTARQIAIVAGLLVVGGFLALGGREIVKAVRERRRTE